MAQCSKAWMRLMNPREDRHVHDEPHKPTGKPRQPDGLEVEDGATAGNRGHAPEVAVREGYSRLAVESVLDDVGGEDAGPRGDAGPDLTVKPLRATGRRCGSSGRPEIRPPPVRYGFLENAVKINCRVEVNCGI